MKKTLARMVIELALMVPNPNKQNRHDEAKRHAYFSDHILKFLTIKLEDARYHISLLPLSSGMY